MNVHIVIPMPTETQLREWEQSLTRVVGRSSSFEVRDPAFMDREPNPVVEIRAEDGEVIYTSGEAILKRLDEADA